MSTEGESGKRNDHRLDDIVRDAEEYYNYLKKKHTSGTRLDVAVVSVVVWFATLLVIGLGLVAIAGGDVRKVTLDSLILVAGIAAVIGPATGFATYAVKRRRGTKFAELGTLINKMKQGDASAEAGLHLMDAMHQAVLTMKKRRLDSAFEYGVVAFILVGLFGSNAGAGLLAGIIVYLYLRHEALKSYEKEEKKYDDSKNNLLQSL